MPYNTLAEARRWAAAVGGSTYAIDDQTAIIVVDDAIEIISEGQWQHLAPEPAP